MKSRTRRSFQLEGLEGRVVLSSIAHRPPAAVHAVHASGSRANVLAGSVHLDFKVDDLSNPILPNPTGTGNVRPLGQVGATVLLNDQSKPTAPLVLSNDQGSLSLAIVAKAPPGASKGRPLMIPTLRGTATVAGGTGAYANLSGRGTVTIRSGPVDAQDGAFSETVTLNIPLRTG